MAQELSLDVSPGSELAIFETRYATVYCIAPMGEGLKLVAHRRHRRLKKYEMQEALGSDQPQRVRLHCGRRKAAT